LRGQFIEQPENSPQPVIRDILERKNIIQRRDVGGPGDAQILAANVDTVLIATSVNQDLNFRRLERYLAVARESHSTPVILLTKADLCASSLISRDLPQPSAMGSALKASFG
jgi:ribosome biogenesis GTPase